MSKLAFLSGGTGVTALSGLAVVAVVGAGAYFSGAFEPEMSESVKAVALPEKANVEPSTVEVEEKSDVPEAAVDAAPSFDLVRVEEGGSAIVAGQAEAGTRVEIKLDGDVVGEATAGADGRFASVLNVEEKDVPQVMSLSDGEGKEGLQQVIIAPAPVVEPASVAVLENTPEPSVQEAVTEDAATQKDETEAVDAMPVTQSQPVVAALQKSEEAVVDSVKAVETEAPATVVSSVETQDQEPEVAQASPIQVTAPAAVPEPAAAPATAKETAAAPTVLLADESGVRVLQQPGGTAPEALTALLGAISYDGDGDVSLTGSADGSFVRVYLDDAPISTSRIAADGNWQANLPNVDQGIYTLRVDELDASGDVVGRVETPFKREAAEVLEAASVPDAAIQSITVQPGATLWAIARDRYGSGTLYTRLFDANKDAIRDPDLIYPGQIFSLPE